MQFLQSWLGSRSLYRQFSAVFRLIGCLLPPLREQHPRLDEDERRSHGEEAACQLQIERLRSPKVSEILLGDLMDRYVVNIDPILRHKVQQKIQRPFEDRKIHLIFFFDRSHLLARTTPS